MNRETTHTTARSTPTKSSLSAPQRQLIELMQTLNFGRIEGLAVRDGEPVFDPPPKVIQRLKLAGEDGPRQEFHSADFLLKKQAVALMHAISDLGDGTVLIIDVKHGLPFVVDIELGASVVRLLGAQE